MRALFGPLASRFFDWLLQFVPDFEITLPSIYIPVPSLPQIYLPTPAIAWPDIDFPDPPVWLMFLMEYSRIWVPIVIGLAVGIIAVRNHRKSEREKQLWEVTHSGGDGAPGET